MPKPMLTTVNLEYNLPSSGYYVIDLMYGLSAINRKSYRSGMVVSVDNMEYVSTDGSSVRIVKIPETYMTLRAWQLGFELWKKQRSDSMDNSQLGPGKWSDFKVFYNEPHRLGEWADVLPVVCELESNPTGDDSFSVAELEFDGGEWNRAELVVRKENSTDEDIFFLGMLGASNDTGVSNYGGLIQAWADTRASTMAPDPNVPATASDSWIMYTEAAPLEMTETVLNLVETENDHPPYANTTDVNDTPIILGGSETASAGVLHDRATIGSTGRPVQLQGGLFPLGLICVQCNVDGGTLRVNVTRGDYKGIAALPMGDFN